MKRWLTAERASELETAEHALGRLMRALPEPLAPVDFSAAVMARIGLGPVPAVWSLAARWGVAALMVAAALSLTLMPLVLWSLSGIFRLGALVDVTAVALVGASRGLASWLALWQSLGEIQGVVLDLVSRPQIALALVGMLLISALALRLMSGLVASNRSSDYA